MLLEVGRTIALVFRASTINMFSTKSQVVLKNRKSPIQNITKRSPAMWKQVDTDSIRITRSGALFLLRQSQARTSSSFDKNSRLAFRCNLISIS